MLGIDRNLDVVTGYDLAVFVQQPGIRVHRRTLRLPGSVKRMRKAAGWNDSLLTEVLAQVF